MGMCNLAAKIIHALLMLRITHSHSEGQNVIAEFYTRIVLTWKTLPFKMQSVYQLTTPSAQRCINVSTK